MQEGTYPSPSHLEVTLPFPDPSRERGDVFAAQCPTRSLLDRLADKWSVMVLSTLDDGPMRFNALRRRIEGVSQKMLSQTVRQLERDGLVSRLVEPTVPVSVTYALTPLGRTLVVAIQPIIDWAETRMGSVAAAQAEYDARAASI